MRARGPPDHDQLLLLVCDLGRRRHQVLEVGAVHRTSARIRRRTASDSIPANGELWRRSSPAGSALINAPLVGYTKVRLGLLLYSHLTEVDSIYMMLANLTRVIAGDRYVVDPFLDYYRRNRKGEPQFLSAQGKIRALREMLNTAGHSAVADLLDWFFHASVRNAFAHADYTLHEDRFRSRSEWFEIRGIRTSELPLATLGGLVNRVLAFYDVFMHEYATQRRSYTSNKVVIGRIGGDANPPEPVELLADPERGLYGFRSPPTDAPE